MYRSLLSLSLALLCACEPPPIPLDEEGSTEGEDGEPSDPNLPSDLDPEQLDRSEDVGPCGYPGPGPQGYGFEVGQRLAPFSLITCEGEPVEFAELMCPRDDTTANRAIMLHIVSTWSAPAQDQTQELEPTYAPWYAEGFELLEVMLETSPTEPIDPDTCILWRDEAFGAPLPFLVTRDPHDPQPSWSAPLLEDAAVPVTLIVDANANIRWLGLYSSLEQLEGVVESVLDAPYGEP